MFILCEKPDYITKFYSYEINGSFSQLHTEIGDTLT